MTRYGAIKRHSVLRGLDDGGGKLCGAVSSTYEETQSGIDKLNVALQALKITAGGRGRGFDI